MFVVIKCGLKLNVMKRKSINIFHKNIKDKTWHVFLILIQSNDEKLLTYL